MKEDLIKLVKDQVQTHIIVNYLRDNKVDYVPDGVWDLEDIEVVPIDTGIYKPTKEQLDAHSERVVSFLRKHPDFVIANAYETQYPFLLSRKPTIKVEYEGGGFSYGSNNIIENCPKRILICAEDD